MLSSEWRHKWFAARTACQIRRMRIGSMDARGLDSRTTKVAHVKRIKNARRIFAELQQKRRQHVEGVGGMYHEMDGLQIFVSRCLVYILVNKRL